MAIGSQIMLENFVVLYYNLEIGRLILRSQNYNRTKITKSSIFCHTCDFFLFIKMYGHDMPIESYPWKRNLWPIYHNKYMNDEAMSPAATDSASRIHNPRQKFVKVCALYTPLWCAKTKTESFCCDGPPKIIIIAIVVSDGTETKVSNEFLLGSGGC